MTDVELRDAAMVALKRTSVSYPEWERRAQQGRYPDVTRTEWWKAFDSLGRIGEAPPPQLFGALLPPRIQASPGPLIPVTSTAALTDALRTCALGSTVDGGGRTFDLAGGTALWNRAGTPMLVTTLQNCQLTRGGTNSAVRADNGGSYFRVRNVEVSDGEGIKITGGAHHIEVDGGSVHDCRSQGILVTGATTRDWQVWNMRLARNGSETNKDHNLYIATASLGCVIGNCEGVDPWAYNLQMYPSCVGLLVTCCNFTGGLVHPDSRGGIVIGSESTLATRDNILVGILVRGAPTAAGVHINAPSSANVVYDSFGWANAGGDFAANSGVRYVGCAHAERGLVAPERFGWVPPFDIDGKARRTADAGCYAP